MSEDSIHTNQDAQLQAPNLPVDSQWLQSPNTSLNDLTSARSRIFDTLWDNTDQTFKTNYNKVLRESNKFQKSRSKCWFLKQSLTNKVVPKTLRSKTNHKPFHSVTVSRWENEENAQSIRQLKCALSDEKITVSKLHSKQSTLNNTLINSVPLGFQNILRERLLLKADSQYRQERHNHKLRLLNLLEEGQRPIPPYLTSEPRINKNKKRRFIKHSKYLRKKRKNANKKLAKLFINYSDFHLTEAMQRLLNRHLSFTVMPQHFNSTQLDVDFKRFSRTLHWIEIFIDDNTPVIESIFKNKKSNLPKEKQSKELRDFLNAIKSMIFGSKLNKVNTNLPADELEALKQLVEAQRYHQKDH